MKLPKPNILFIAVISALFFLQENAFAQSIYFPPTSGDEWETTDPESLGWCTDYIDTLYNFLEAENTKGFLVLKDGKLVLEKYFGTFEQDSLWYWASAGKTITAFLVGKAQENGDLNINESTNTYLGEGWTSCTTEQENNITIRNQLTMTSGLDDGVADNHCTIDTCLQYLDDAGSRWAYHNAPYTLLESVLENSTSTDINIYTYSQLKSVTGITGLWLTIDYDNVYFSDTRSMARFGLLIQNNGNWNGTTVMNDSEYFNQMINTSQELNKSYGYLWWLNGKESFMLPGSQFIFPGSYAPDAPDDMFAALGKNGQIISIANSLGLVIIRMGNAPEDYGEIPAVLCNDIWQHLNTIMCSSSAFENTDTESSLQLYPNPTRDNFTIKLPEHVFDLQILDMQGKEIFSKYSVNQTITIATELFSVGVYIVQIKTLNGLFQKSVLIIE